MHLSQKKEKREYLFPLLLLIVTIGIYNPSSLFLANINEFQIDYPQILPSILIASLLLLLLGIAGGLIANRIGKLGTVYTDLLFGFALAVYIQGSFLKGGLEQMNGAEIVWKNLSPESLTSIIVWLACLTLPHIIRRVSAGTETAVVRFGSLALSAMQVISLAVLLLTTVKIDTSQYALTTDGEFELSEEDNVVVFVVDTLDAKWTESFVLNNEEYLKKLDGFTYFDNVVAGGAPTILGMRMMLTGKAYDPETNLDEYILSVYKESPLFSD